MSRASAVKHVVFWAICLEPSHPIAIKTQLLLSTSARSYPSWSTHALFGTLISKGTNCCSSLCNFLLLEWQPAHGHLTLKWSLNHHFQLPSLSSRWTYFKVLSTYKCLNSYTFCPPGNFSLHTNPNLHFCHCKQLVVPLAKTSAFYNSFFISSARLWNCLPSHVILCANVSTFKNAVKPFLLG